MIMSFRESRWKHMVTTSESAAPLQMGRDCARQKARLHCEHEGEEEPARLGPRGLRRRDLVSREGFRPSTVTASSSSSKEGIMGSMSSRRASSSEEGESTRWEPVRGAPAVVDLISMMVLLVKQVHLQKVGAAVAEALVGGSVSFRTGRIPTRSGY